jgi:serine/threonine protein kinase
MTMEASNYEVIKLLGEGGIGRVYEAVHHPSRRAVAIKTLRSEHGGPTSQRQLLNEAAAVAQIAHPAIVELIDVGRDDWGRMFLVMELVRGSSLESWARAFPGLRVVLGATCEMLDALATAHAQGIVHGDLKPANVLLSAEGRVKVTDFGIAHVTDPLRAPATRRGLQGTPYYMAPEQLIDVDAIAPPTDLYAVGMMLYELLSGREPYSSEGTLGDMVARKLAAVRPFEPRPGLAVPRGLGAIVLSLLDPDPRLRPRFAAGLQRSLESILHALPPDTPLAIVGSPLRAVDSVVSAPTISSSDELPAANSTNSRSLPFTLPCTAATPEVSLHRLRPLPLIGRDDHTAKLLSLTLRAQSRTCGLVVAGRAGEGKTRLLRHGFAEVERTGTMLGVAASFDETIVNTEVGLRACMRKLLGPPGRALAETLASRWRWLTRVPQPGVDFETIHEWLSAESRPLDLEATVRVASMCVLAASRIYPVYLWLDDVAWSRDGAMELMVRLLERNQARALVVATLRSGTAEHPQVRDWLLRVARVGAELDMLPPLSTSDRIALIEAAGPVSRDVAEALGNSLNEPTLVLVETVRAWIDAGILVPKDGRYTLRSGTSIDDVAARAASSVLGQRISTLIMGFGRDAAAAERVLCHAALLGLRFEEQALRLCGDAAWVDRVLDRALLAGLLRVDGRGAYRFEHRLFLDVIVERAAVRADAADIFLATADALASVHGTRNTDNALALAMLYHAGGAQEKAVRIAVGCVRSLSRAAVFDAADRALALLASWIEPLPPDHLHRAILEHAYGARDYFAMDYPRARKHLQAARQAFEALGAIEDLDGVFMDLSSTHYYQDHFAESERYVRLIQRQSDAKVRARTRHRLADLSALRLDFDAAAEHLRKAIEADLETSEQYALALRLATLVELLIAAGELDQAAVSANHLAQVSNAVGDRYLASDTERVMAVLDAARGYFGAARARLTPRIAALVARNDDWHLTADLSVIALCAAAQNESVSDVTLAVQAVIRAYTKVPQDEPCTWWAIRSAEAYLRHGRHTALADELGAMLDVRLERIAQAFDDEEPITEDEELRSDAAKRASSR